jgi:sigma-B regulation protein RsbU (phosphoserine phosphatase)
MPLDKKTSKETTLQQLDKRLLELTALFEISRSLSSSLNLRSILESFLRISMGHMLISRGIILLKKDEDNEFYVEELKGLPRTLLKKSLRIDSPPSYAVLTDEIKDNNKWIDFFREFQIKLIFPLTSSQGIIGIVGFGKKIGDIDFEEKEFEFLDSLSNIAASAVSNGLMVEEIQGVNNRLDRKIQQLNTIFDISRELNTTLDKKKIGSLLSFAIMGELLVNKCIVLIKENKKFDVLIAKGVAHKLEMDPKSCSIDQFVILEDSDKFDALRQLGFAIVVPMQIQNETKGLLAVGPKISGGRFDESDIEFLKTLGNQGMTSIENAQLFDEMLEKQRLEEELNLARSIQQNLLPSTLPRLKGYEIAAVNIPSKQVGGDYYDVIPITEQEFGIAIADVSGKGAGAALLMSNLQASLHALVCSGMKINVMVERMNNLIYQNTALDKYITFLYGVLDNQTHVFTYCNAGHNPPYKIDKSGKFTELMTGGIVLGMMPDMTFETAQTVLKPEDRIVFFTDGITESMNEKDEEFGEVRVKNLMLKYKDDSAQSLLEKFVSETERFRGKGPQTDDITLLIIKSVG